MRPTEHLLDRGHRRLRLLPALVCAALAATSAWPQPATSAAGCPLSVDAASVPADVPGEYRHVTLLKVARQRYAALAAAPRFNDLPPLPARRSLRGGDAYAGLPALWHSLQQWGDLDPSLPPPPPGAVLDATLVEALQRFQSRHGLEPDGVLGPATWRALVVPMSLRLRQIDLSLARARRLPPRPAGRFIVVNIPQFRLYAFASADEEEASMLAMDVIVGRSLPTQRTPAFSASLKSVVFRPYWDVPGRILREELLPDLRRDREALARQGFEAVRGPADESPVVPWSAAAVEALARGELRLRQRPGPLNPLGQVKFLLPNEHAVYLHSTAAPRLFAATRRTFSHGCVRVADAEALARYVLGQEPGWDAARIAAALASQAPPERVTLQQPLPVLLVYATAIAAEDGRVLFFEDVYGHDRRDAAAAGR
ncbi:MAG: hypothetical protein RL026_1593 [Pseudomonadota bacterium]|jgi:murein L,D-transpeptidase YcbB/YkuD